MKKMSLTDFDWDEGNKTKNVEKHNVSNKECEEVFFNSPLRLYVDEKHSQKENRYTALGETFLGRKLYIVFTFRGKKIRIISARNMSAKEKGLYEKK